MRAVNSPSRSVRSVEMVLSPSCTKTPMSGWKSKPWSVTSWPPGPDGGEMKSSGEGTAAVRATAIFWFDGPELAEARVGPDHVHVLLGGVDGEVVADEEAAREGVVGVGGEVA